MAQFPCEGLRTLPLWQRILTGFSEQLNIQLYHWNTKENVCRFLSHTSLTSPHLWHCDWIIVTSFTGTPRRKWPLISWQGEAGRGVQKIEGTLKEGRTLCSRMRKKSSSSAIPGGLVPPINCSSSQSICLTITISCWGHTQVQVFYSSTIHSVPAIW